jgi:hypothetical protein
VDARAYFREVLTEAARLGLGFWERIALILGAALVVVSFRSLGSALRSVSFNVKIEPAPEPISDGGMAADRELPPAQQDPNAANAGSDAG